MRRTTLALTVLIALFSGCARETPKSSGRLIADYAPGKDAEVSKAPYQATYILRHWPNPPADPPPKHWVPDQEIVDLFIRGLDKRQAVGFEKTSDGNLVAVAGEEKIKLEPGRYAWHIHPSTEYTGLKWVIHETGERTVEIISLPFGLAAAALVVPFIFCGFLLVLPFAILL
ncbi:MAG: hypothetical protein HY289_02770 [Planctomycetes bacterium]|nr:hypothetical protein [Planctomycetota bacterium]